MPGEHPPHRHSAAFHNYVCHLDSVWEAGEVGEIGEVRSPGVGEIVDLSQRHKNNYQKFYFCHRSHINYELNTH